MDGNEWKETRKKMDKVFPQKKTDVLEDALHYSNLVSNMLIESWVKKIDETPRFKDVPEGMYQIENLERCMHTWSVESILAILFGSSYFAMGK